MSVLPLVFPDNMSCFSRGSYKVMMVIVMMFKMMRMVVVLVMMIILTTLGQMVTDHCHDQSGHNYNDRNEHNDICYAAICEICSLRHFIVVVVFVSLLCCCFCCCSFVDVIVVFSFFLFIFFMIIFPQSF